MHFRRANWAESRKGAGFNNNVFVFVILIPTGGRKNTQKRYSRTQKSADLSTNGIVSFSKTKKVASHQYRAFFAGNYSCLLAELHLRRSLGFHMVQSYLPTILIVVISWVSFWMDVDSVAGRTTLGVTTLLTVSSKASGKCTITVFPIFYIFEKKNTGRRVPSLSIELPREGEKGFLGRGRGMWELGI